MKHEQHITAANLHPLIERLVRIRMGWQMTAPEIADRIGIKERAFYYYESGFRYPNFFILNKWARVLGYELTIRPARER